MSTMVRTCFCCAKALTHCGPRDRPDSVSNPPNDATWWRTPGNYGSTVFDPLDGTRLEIFVCDQCLLERKARVHRVQIGHSGLWELVQTTLESVFR